MTFEELVDQFKNNEKFVAYVAKRFLVPTSLDDIARDEGLPAGAFYKLFAEYPELETVFREKVAEEDSNAKDLFLCQASMQALLRLYSIINEDDEIDRRDLIQACRAILTYRPSVTKKPEKDPFASMFKDLVDGGNGE